MTLQARFKKKVFDPVFGFYWKKKIFLDMRECSALHLYIEHNPHDPLLCLQRFEAYPCCPYNQTVVGRE